MPTAPPCPDRTFITLLFSVVNWRTSWVLRCSTRTDSSHFLWAYITRSNRASARFWLSAMMTAFTPSPYATLG